MPFQSVEFDDGVSFEATWRAPSSGDTSFDALRKGWLGAVFGPYVRNFLDQYGGQPRRVELPLRLCDRETEFSFLLNQTLLDQVFEAYGAYGWAALAALRDAAAKTQSQQTCQFIDATLRIVWVAIARELVRLEVRLGELAAERWRSQREGLERHLAEFEPIGQGGYKYTHQFRDRAKGKSVFKLCARYAVELRRFKWSEVRLKDRKQKDGGPTARRSRGQELWSELYAQPQRDVMGRMSSIIKELNAVFPGAVLALADLPENTGDPIGSDVGVEYWERARPVDAAIHKSLTELAEYLLILEGSLLRAKQTDKLTAYIGKSGAVPPEGPEALILDRVLASSSDDNRVLADVGFVAHVLAEVEAQRPISWERVVLKRYYLQLKAQLEVGKQEREEWERLWGWVERVTAALALLALLAFVPFGLGAVAVAAPVTTALAAIGIGALAFSAIVLLHDLFDLAVEQRDEQAKVLREHLCKLGQSDAESLSEVGAVLKRSRELRNALSVGLLTTLFQLALAKKLRPVALALELDGFLGDVRTLLAPVTVYNE